MRFLITALTLSLLAAISSVHAKPAYTTSQLCKVLQPCLAPAKYSSGPFVAKPVVRNVSLRDVQTICGNPFTANRKGNVTVHAVMSGDGALGCATFTNNVCLVHVPSDLKTVLPDLYRLVLAHELAHCRGWVHK